MADVGMLYTAPMVRAIQAGLKTQTRRMVVCSLPIAAVGSAADWDRWKAHPQMGTPDIVLLGENGRPFSLRCPYGRAGGRLWVRETFYAFGRWGTRFSAKKGRDEWHFIDMTLECGHAYSYAADGGHPLPLRGRRDSSVTPGWWKRPAIFMPRAACRLTLEVSGISVERLQAISEADAVAEGIEANWIGDLTKGPNGLGGEGWTPEVGWRNYEHSEDGEPAYTAVESYRSLWNSINGTGSWDANPWVWAIAFRKVA